MIHARIDSVISFDTTSLPDPLVQQIIADLSPRHPDKDRAVAELIQGSDEMPDQLRLWKARGNELILPRGYVHRLESLALSFGQEVEWSSSMTLLPPSEHCFRGWSPFPLRDYQTPAVEAMLDWSQGLYQAPTGVGKTATALEFSRWAGQRTLVIVGKTNLARQWQEAARERYGYETGYFGEGEWNEKDFSVGLWQTLWTRDIPEAFWKHWGCVIFDEVQHASSNSLSDLAGRFPAFYRIGLSATPRWDPLLFPIVEAVIGPVIHKTVVDDVGEHLLRPEIQQVESNFAAEYIGTHFDGRKRISNNYGEVMAALVADDDRNDLIARIAREEAQAGHQVLIVTRRIEHVKQLVSRLEKVFKIGRDLHALTGAQTGADAQRIGRAIENAEGGSVLISTTADEGLDIPRLDRLIMAFPLRRLPLVEQQIGRIVRPASNKHDAIVWDITDPQVGPLKSQRKDRAQFYGRKGWKTKRIEKEGTCLISS